MRCLFILLALAACGATPEQLATGAGAIALGSISIIQRSPADAVYSVVSGKDCSIVRLEQGKTYCRPTESQPEPPPYCTRSLGVVDCWRDPASLPDRPTELGDGPRTLTPAQEADRTRAWPSL